MFFDLNWNLKISSTSFILIYISPAIIDCDRYPFTPLPRAVEILALSSGRESETTKWVFYCKFLLKRHSVVLAGSNRLFVYTTFMADGRSLPNRSGSRSSKTFKPKKNIPEGTHQYDLMKHAAATLGSGNLRLAVMLPDGEDQNEWVAVNSNDTCCFVQLVPILIYLLLFSSCRLFQSNQHALWYDYWVLHWRKLSHHVSWAKVWIPLGRWSNGKETHQVLCPQVHRLPHDLGTRSVGWWKLISIKNWYAWH